MAAFRGQDWPGAREALQRLTATGRADAGAFALLGTACFHLDDLDAANAAASDALLSDPRQLRALLVKADVLQAQGDARAANVLYGSVIEAADGLRTLAPDLLTGVARARDARHRILTDMEDHIRATLDTAGYREDASSRRFTHALDLLTNRKKLYVQEPRYFYYPGLPTVEFYPRQDFPWLDSVEAATDAIADELTAVLQDDVGFVPYVQSQPHAVRPSVFALTDSLDWSSCFLWKDGVETPHAEACPRTMQVLNAAPLCRINGRSPLIMFSQLKPGAHITPHTGVLNTRLLCHLPLVVPPGCRLRVGNEERQWEKGKAWVFNDTIEHEARNDSDETRVILIFDVWRPELDEEERALISTLLMAMDIYAPPMSWD